MTSLLTSLALLLGFLLLTLYGLLLPPRHPRTIPAVPFWVALIPFFRDVDQSDLFAKYIRDPLRTHGAVKLFFGAQWNILVHKPSLLVEIFRNEDLYQKSGNYKKIAHSVLAEFLGENIISSYGAEWQKYRSVMKPGLQRDFEADKVHANAQKLRDLLQQEQLRARQCGIAVQDLLQRYSVANCCEGILHTKVDVMDNPHSPIHLLQTAVKREIFRPIFMNFPFLDRIPFPSRTRARKLVCEFKNRLLSSLRQSHEDGNLATPKGPEVDLGQQMLDAFRKGTWTGQELLDNLLISFVAGQENPQLCMISTLYLLAKHPDTQAKLYREMEDRQLGERPDADALQELPFLTSVIYESLRLFPPIGQLVNRRVAVDTVLGDGIFIPRGTYVGYNCYSTNRDGEAWGPTADEFRPERWGETTADIQRHYRQRRVRGEFISFHGGRRACLGEKFALLELRVTLFVLVRAFTWALDPSWPDRKTPAGPLYPRALRLVFTAREESRMQQDKTHK